MENFRIEKNVLVKYTGDEANVTIPEHVRAIGAQAFAFNTAIETVVIPKGVVTIGERAFDNCQNLVSVDIPKTVSMIENNAFASCKKLESVTIPDGVPFIAARTFYMCLSLKSVVLPAGVTSISDEAFARCISLEEIAIGDEILEIGEKAFMECYGLKRVSIGKGVEVIKWNTFSYCKTLEKVALTSSLRVIEYGAFDSCPEITDVYFDASEATWAQVNVKPTRNETLLRAAFHFDYTDSIVSVAAPVLVEEVAVETLEETVLTEEEEAILYNHYTKCMRIIYALNTDAKLKNLLQYGYENTNYKFVRNEKHEATDYVTLIKSEQVTYEMNPIYTGNLFISYYCDELGWNEEIYSNILRQNADAKTQEYKVSEELNNIENYLLGLLPEDGSVNSSTTIDLPSYGSTFSDVEISWTVDNENAIINSDGTLTFVAPESETIVNLYVTVSVNGYTPDTQYFFILTVLPDVSEDPVEG